MGFSHSRYLGQSPLGGELRGRAEHGCPTPVSPCEDPLKDKPPPQRTRHSPEAAARPAQARARTASVKTTWSNVFVVVEHRRSPAQASRGVTDSPSAPDLTSAPPLKAAPGCLAAASAALRDDDWETD